MDLTDLREACCVHSLNIQVIEQTHHPRPEMNPDDQALCCRSNFGSRGRVTVKGGMRHVRIIEFNPSIL